MNSLYEQAQGFWDSISGHRPYTVQLSKMVASFHEMEAALGYGNSVVKKWISGENRVSLETERRAGAFVRAAKSMGAQQDQANKAHASGDDAFVVLVACNSSQLQKLKKIAAVLGFEVVE